MCRKWLLDVHTPSGFQDRHIPDPQDACITNWAPKPLFERGGGDPNGRGKLRVVRSAGRSGDSRILRGLFHEPPAVQYRFSAAPDGPHFSKLQPGGVEEGRDGDSSEYVDQRQECPRRITQSGRQGCCGSTPFEIIALGEEGSYCLSHIPPLLSTQHSHQHHHEHELGFGDHTIVEPHKTLIP